MKTKTQIAKENIESYKDIDGERYLSISETHKASCQRFLEFLEREYKYLKDLNILVLNVIERKIVDLKQAIKLYDKVGI